MTAIVLSKTETMTGYNTHVELDEVHTPSRYIAIAFFCFLGRPILLQNAAISCLCGANVFPSLSPRTFCLQKHLSVPSQTGRIISKDFPGQAVDNLWI
jgi:hypothetical protein